MMKKQVPLWTMLLLILPLYALFLIAGSSGGNPWYWAGTDIRHQGATDSTTCVQVLDADGGTPILDVNCTDERVGIGTATPANILDVSGTGEVVNVGDGSGDSTYTRWASSRAGFGYDGVAATIQAGVGKGINLNVNNNSFGSGIAVSLASSGNVGIGTVSPAYELDVNGRLHGTQISASESYKAGLAVVVGTDASHDIDVAVGIAQSFDGTHDITFAAQAGKQLDVKWAAGAAAGMLGVPDTTSAIVLTFSLTASPDTITAGSGTPFALCNAETNETGTVIIEGGDTNNGTFEVASCTDTVLTLGEGVLSGDETGDSGEYESRYIIPNTFYHVFLIELAGAEDICADTSEIATNCLSESSYDQYRFLQSILTGDTANLVAF